MKNTKEKEKMSAAQSNDAINSREAKNNQLMKKNGVNLC